MPQWAVIGWPGQIGQTSFAALSQTVNTKSKVGAPGCAGRTGNTPQRQSCNSGSGHEPAARNCNHPNGGNYWEWCYCQPR